MPCNISLNPFQQSQTPNHWQMKTSSDVMDGGYGSVGPIRRVRNKLVSEPQSETLSMPSSSNASRSFVPVFQKNPVTDKKEPSRAVQFEPGLTKTDRDRKNRTEPAPNRSFRSGPRSVFFENRQVRSGPVLNRKKPKIPAKLIPCDFLLSSPSKKPIQQL